MSVSFDLLFFNHTGKYRWHFVREAAMIRIAKAPSVPQFAVSKRAWALPHPPPPQDTLTRWNHSSRCPSSFYLPPPTATISVPSTLALPTRGRRKRDRLELLYTCPLTTQEGDRDVYLSGKTVPVLYKRWWIVLQEPCLHWIGVWLWIFTRCSLWWFHPLTSLLSYRTCFPKIWSGMEWLTCLKPAI